MKGFFYLKGETIYPNSIPLIKAEKPEGKGSIRKFNLPDPT
jgi:hypothetical protein